MDSEEPGRGDEQPGISHVAVLKALADPIRMNLLYALTHDTGASRPTMTVKELAAALGEPQTKLYRHVKHLEAAGLIRAVASRVVSGIVEQRYQACRTDLSLGDELTEAERTGPEAEAMAAAALEMYRRQYFAARRAQPPARSATGTVPASGTGPASGTRPEATTLLGIWDGRVPVTRAAEIRAQLRQILDEVSNTQTSSDEPTVPLNLLLGYFSPEPPPD